MAPPGLPPEPAPEHGALGVEWVVDVEGCAPARLRDPAAIRALFDRVVADLSLKPVGEPLVHKFGPEGGVTALLLLSESHLSVHTFPEVAAATLDLYCCRARPAYDWRAVLGEALGATRVSVRTLARGGAP